LNKIYDRRHEKIVSCFSANPEGVSRLKETIPRICHEETKILEKLIYFSLFHSHLQYCIVDWGQACKIVIRPVQVLQNRILKYMTFSKRTSSANNIFKLLKILKVSDLHQLSLAKFVYKYNAYIIPSSLDNIFSKLHGVHDHATRQQVLGNYHQKRVRTDYGK